MITIKNVRMLDGSTSDFTVPSTEDTTLDAMSRLFLIPGIVDTHIHLNSLNREDWHHDLLFAIKAGITTVLDCPIKTSFQNLKERKKLIETYLSDLQLPMDHFFYFRATQENIKEIGLSKALIKGVYLPEESLLGNETNFADRVFQIAAIEDFPMIVNLREQPVLGPTSNQKSLEILEKALFFAEKWNVRLLLLSVALEEELTLIQEAKNRILLIYSETTPEILLSLDDNTHLWEAIKDNRIDCIGSGYYSPATYNIKNQEIPSFPAFLLATLLTAYHEGKISLDLVAQLTNYQPREIFEIKQSQDIVLLDLDKTSNIRVNLHGRVEEKTFHGFPAYTLLKGRLFSHF